MNNKEIEIIYKALKVLNSNINYNLNELTEFLSKTEDRKHFHNKLSSKLGLGTFEQFEKRVTQNPTDLFLNCALKKGTPFWEAPSGSFVIIYETKINGVGSGNITLYDNNTFKINTFQPDKGVRTWLKQNVTGTITCTSNGMIKLNPVKQKVQTTKSQFVDTNITIGEVTNGTKLLTYGLKGSAVGELQKALNNKGYKLRVDNIFGSNTLTAVKQFQQSVGLKADGKVGKQTWAALTKQATADPQAMFNNYFERAVARFDMDLLDRSEGALKLANQMKANNPNLVLNNRAEAFYKELMDKSDDPKFANNKEQFIRMANLIKPPVNEIKNILRKKLIELNYLK